MKRFNLPTWKDIAHFFEKGDLTPLAVVISVAHYGPVLMRHNDSMLVAWLVGAMIDFIHFRTVRRLFQVRGRKAIIGHALVALLTTVMALGYHLRFYENDLLLALPIPIGIGILAQHAAAKVHDETLAKWRKRMKFVLGVAKKLQSSLLEKETRVSVLESAVLSLQADDRNLKGAEAKLQEQARQLKEATGKLQEMESRLKEMKDRANKMQGELQEWKERGRAVTHLNPVVIDIGLMLAGDPITQKQIADRHNLTETEVSRLKARLNGVENNV